MAMPQVDEETRSLLRCPSTAEPLRWTDEGLTNLAGTVRWDSIDDVPDLRCKPARLRLDMPWVEPWDEIDEATFDPPEPVDAPDLPFHLDRYQAGIVERSRRCRVLEVGCGERAAESFFARRGFTYVGTDIDFRGRGPHVLCDAHNLPFADNSFGLYYAMAVYEHLVCPYVAAHEAFRVLEPGGIAFGSAAFMFGFHDRASFFHMSHGGLLALLQSAGFTQIRIWPGWEFTDSIPTWAYSSKMGAPWRVATKAMMKVAEYSYTRTFNLARRVAGKQPVDLQARRSQIAGGLNFMATKPRAESGRASLTEAAQ